MTEKSKNAPTRKLSTPTLSLLAVATVFFLLWLCFGITINFRIPAWEFELARERWEASNISDYEMTIGLYSMVSIAQIAMVVEDNQIVSMASEWPLDDEFSPPPSPIDLSQEPSWYTEEFGFSSWLAPSLQDYEIGRMFEFTEEAILPVVPQEFVSLCTSTNTHYELAFNQEYGFIEEIILTNCPAWNVGAGLLCPTISDCQSTFRVIEFVP